MRKETVTTMSADPLIVDGCRTPFQRIGTGFRDMQSYQLAAAAINGLLRRNELDGAAVDRVVIGAIVPNPRATNQAREAALLAGLPPQVPAVTVTAAGVSATVAIDHGADLIRSGQADVVIAGGSDCLSDPPIGFRRAMRKKLLGARRLRGPWQRLRFLLSLRPWDFLPDVPELAELSTGETMGQFSERLARRLKIERTAQDAYALASHRRAAAARAHLAEEIVPVQTPDGVVEQDNGIRPDTSLEQLAALPPSFHRRKGTLTAGNASFLTDGAAVVLLMSEAKAASLGVTPQAWLRASVLTAQDPKDELLLGPVTAVPRVLAKAGLSYDDLDVVEIHEAFAAQVLAVLHHLPDLPQEHLNAWGGSLAIGNPFAPNGARLMTTAAHRLAVEGGRWGLVTTCAGGGLGQGMVLERVG